MRILLFKLLVLLGIFLIPLGIYSQFRDSSNTKSLPRARWIQDGMIDAGGSHEPFLFVVRRGGRPMDAYEQYQKAQSEEVIRRLRDQGVEVFHTHLYKGFGMMAEKPEMEDAKRVASIAHRYGLKVDSYIQWNTMMYETFFAEEPRAKDWIQRDALGRPILLTYGYQQSYRYRPCFANQEYLDYLKKIVRFAVEEVKTDFIHFDNFDLNSEPDSCHCSTCIRRFREFLKAKYSAEKRIERFGFENVDYVNPPQWNAQNPPQKMQIIFDPAIQEWIDFRCQTMAEGLHQMASLAKSLNPEVAIEVNPHGITGGNRAWEAGLDHARFLKSTEAFWTEEENEPGLVSDGRLITKIRSYKLARAFDNVLLTDVAPDPVAMAECLAFNQTPGFVGLDPLPPGTLKYLSFYRSNREIYTRTKEAAGVAVLRSYPSIAYHNARAQLSAILVEQALIQSRIPFELIFDEHLADLSRYRVVILPDSECLSDSQVAAILRYVQNGGGLVATEDSGLYDEWRRVRVQPGLKPLFGSQQRAEAYQETVKTIETTLSSPIQKEYGSGRAVLIASVPFDGPLPEPEPYFAIGNRFWKRPRNWQAIADSVRWAAKSGLPVEVSGPPFLVANLVAQPERGRVVLHLVNYNSHGASSLQSIEVKLQSPEGRAFKEVKLITPESGAFRGLEFRSVGGTIAFTVPEMKDYAIVVAQLAEKP